MRVLLQALLVLAVAVPASAQVFPTPGADTPRVQTVVVAEGEIIVLTALPRTALTVMLEPGQAISRITLEGNRSWDVRISAETDSFQVTPQAGAAPATLVVEARARTYLFSLETGLGLQAGYLVRLLAAADPAEESLAMREEITGLDWSYRLRGDRSVRPVSVRDNGLKTVIEYATGQALPAVFAIGPSGDEEVVDGYMRDGLFIIDRIHQELVFRIDKEKATARRDNRKDDEG